MNEPYPYDTHLNILCDPLEVIDAQALAEACTHPWYNQTLCKVNGSVVRLGVVRGEYHWHKHDEDDEFFYVVEGKLFVDLEGRTVELGPRQGFVVPKGIVHRTRATERTVMLMVENAGIIPPETDMLTTARLLPALAVTCAAALAQDTRVILLGTGTPNPEPDRMGPSVAVVSGDHIYLVDCGPGVVRRAAQAGIRMDQLTRLFVTHLHSDHTAGYPDMILTPPNAGRKTPLEVWGPPGLRDMTSHILKAWKQDSQIRLHRTQPNDPPGYVVTAHEIKPGEIYRDESVRVIAIAVRHGAWAHAYGYRFEAKDRTIVISGDTTYSESLIAAAKDCDILVHEVYSQAGLEKRTPDWRKYHAAYHTSAPDVGRVAAQVRPRKLVLYHLLPMGETPAEVLREVRRNWDGETIYGKDLDVVR